MARRGGAREGALECRRSGTIIDSVVVVLNFCWFPPFTFGFLLSVSSLTLRCHNEEVREACNDKNKEKEYDNK